ncbi:uncharacterized protein ColSpa_07908 [Colletotrichum spaethianum]|uniref:Uncharacterized protein n=1 Tax=Colletotrichum spaethianum TaxID=700344 RepID=A0AA37P8R0_9PEZI|nr:uncharacterized protein ColSpa_07908 [Colletotrichum spaethianum]GKT47727.1 hypothetical protein ColSpa_07908 [Colletotrichum spaethianum]
MDYHSAVLAHPEFLSRMQDASKLPHDLNTLKTWYFTRLESEADRLALLGIYNTLVFDLGWDYRDIQVWLTDLKLYRNIKQVFEANPMRISEERMTWFMEHQSIFRCDQYGHDTPVFRFDALENRKKWPIEWKGMSREEIELAIDKTDGGMETGFETEIERECWLIEMARKWKSGEYNVPY